MASSEMEPERSESLRVMATAFDQVIDRLPEAVERTDEMRREVALFIVDHFRLGEHDPDRLSDLAFAELAPSSGGAGDASLAPEADDRKEPVAR